jgi:hypothetical protein
MLRDNLDKFGSAGKINTVLPNEVKIEFLPRHYCSRRTPGKVGLIYITINGNFNHTLRECVFMSITTSC